METRVQRNGTRILIFCVILLSAYGISALALFGISDSQRPLVSSFAIPFDLMVLLPALFYFLVVKKNGLSPLFVLPVIALGSAFVFQIAHPENLVAVFLIGACALAVEAAIGIRVIIRLTKVFQTEKAQSDDPITWFKALVFDLIPHRRAAKLLSTELSTIYYAFFSWRKKPLVPAGANAFTYHKDSGYLSLMGVILCLLPLETALVHFLLSQWSPEAALVLTILSAYSALWLIGGCRASVLRPLVVSGSTLTINSGMSFSEKVPLSSIESIGSADPQLPKELTVNLGVMGSPNTWVVFSDDIETETFTGTLKKTRAIGLTVDNAPAFRKAVSEALGE